MALQKAMVSSKTNEWATPQALFDELNKEFSFDLDVAATDENTKCITYYTLEDNGLAQAWHLDSKTACWMNPPYGGQTGTWIERACCKCYSDFFAKILRQTSSLLSKAKNGHIILIAPTN